VVLRRRRQAAPPPPAPLPAIDAAPAPEPWPAATAVAAPEEPADVWTPAAEAIDVTDHAIELPALAPMPRRRAARAGRTALKLALVLGCAGAAVAATGVLKTPPQDSPPPTVGEASVVAGTKPHKAKPGRHKAERKPARHKRAHRHAAAAPPHVPAATSAPTPRATPVVRTPSPAPVRHVVSRPAPTPAPKPAAPKPASPKPSTSPQPAASAPSGEPGRQPPSSP
jgi:hypothetical protein